MRADTAWWRHGQLGTLLAEPLTYLVLLFLLSRIALRAAGVSFDTTVLESSWQILDLELLRDDLLRSLLYMHGQPPLYNLVLGLAFKLAPQPAFAAWGLSLLYTGMGLLLTIALYRLLRRLEVATPVAFAAAALFMLSPAAILYENVPYYTLPAAWLLTLATLYCHRTMSRFAFRRALVLFSLLAALIYVRALFQLPWLIVLGLFLLWALPGQRRPLLAAAAVPLLLVVLLYGKNLNVIGQFNTSSWMGMSLSKLTTMRLDEDERAARAAAGKLSRLATVPPFRVPEAYPEHLADTPATGIPVLDRKRKSSEHINFNHLAYAAVSRQYLADALTVLHEEPLLYLEAMGTAYAMYFRPASDYPFLQFNREAIEPLSRWYNRYIAWQPRYPAAPGFDFRGPATVGWGIVAGFVLCLAWGAWLAPGLLQRQGLDAYRATLLFAWLNILYVTVVGNAFEIGENQRFRFLINPLLAVMLATLLQQAADRLQGTLRASPARFPENLRE